MNEEISHSSVELRAADLYYHIDMGLLNRRLCLSALPRDLRDEFNRIRSPQSDHFSVLQNDHLLVTMLLDVYDEVEAPTLRDAIKANKPKIVFRSIERLAPCPDVYEKERVEQDVIIDFETTKPIRLAYHTKHIVSDTGRMTLADGIRGKHQEAIVGVLHDKGEIFEIEPIVIGAPWLDHPRNKGVADSELIWGGYDYGEILAEEIDQFSQLTETTVESAAEWMEAMKSTSEDTVKAAFTSLLNEPSKKDWGGEQNDHFSSSVTVNGIRKTAAFLLKGPSQFREMTPDLCGKRADQIYRLSNSGADISIVQHCHLIGEAVRAELRAFTVQPGRQKRKYCFIDGQATYRILKGYNLLSANHT